MIEGPDARPVRGVSGQNLIIAHVRVVEAVDRGAVLGKVSAVSRDRLGQPRLDKGSTEPDDFEVVGCKGKGNDKGVPNQRQGPMG